MKKNISNPNIIFLFNIFLGLILSFYLLWVRFIRERLPKDLPFNLTFWGFIIILFILISYIYQLKKLIKPIPFFNKPQQPHFLLLQFKHILQIFYKPLIILRETIINNKYLYPLLCYIVKFIIKLFIKLKLYEGHRKQIFNIICFLFPRFIVLLFFCIDIFYWGKLEIFYKILPLGLIPMVISILTSCAQIILEKNIVILEKDFLVELNEKDQTENSNYFFDIDMLPRADNDLKENNFLDKYNYNPEERLIHVRVFIDFQACAMVCKNEPYKYKAAETCEAREEYAKKHNISLDEVYSGNYGKDNISSELRKPFYNAIPYLIELCAFCYSQERKLLMRYYRNTLKIIYTLSIICWTYILFIANSADILPDFILFLQIFQDYIEPFSQSNIT